MTASADILAQESYRLTQTERTRFDCRLLDKSTNHTDTANEMIKLFHPVVDRTIAINDFALLVAFFIALCQCVGASPFRTSQYVSSKFLRCPHQLTFGASETQTGFGDDYLYLAAFAAVAFALARGIVDGSLLGPVPHRNAEVQTIFVIRYEHARIPHESPPGRLKMALNWWGSGALPSRAAVLPPPSGWPLLFDMQVKENDDPTGR